MHRHRHIERTGDTRAHPGREPPVQHHRPVVPVPEGQTAILVLDIGSLGLLDEFEDLYLAEQRLIDNRAGRSRTYTLEEVERELGGLSSTPVR